MKQGNTLVQGNTLARRIAHAVPAMAVAACLWTSPGSGQEPAKPLRERALQAMEALQEEIATLTAMRDAQAALLAWNRESARTDAPSQALAAALCDDPAIEGWCSLLPATFGTASREHGHERD